MSRSDMMARLLRMARLAERGEPSGQDPQPTVNTDQPGSEGRRKFAKGVVAATSAAAVFSLAPGAMALDKRIGLKPIRPRLSGNVAVVGAGIAGLACANELTRQGINARLFEASNRVGGRIASLRDVFPGQVVERGGEFIGSSHHAMLGYARELGLTLEGSGATSGDAFYYFGGSRYTETQVVAEYREFTTSISEDIGTLGSPTADRFKESDAVLDFMSIGDYLDLHGAGGLLRKVIGSAYLAEYGAGIDELSAISFLRFVHGDQRSKQAPFGVHGGEYVRVLEGNDRITSGLAERLPMPASLEHRLVSIRKLAGGMLRLSFDVAGRTVQSDHHAVVMTLPFSVLRDVELHSSLQLPAWKTLAIKSTDMGSHSKLMVGFDGPVWRERHGLNGSGFSDLAAMQATWETNPSRATASNAVLAGYFGGERAQGMSAATTQADAGAFLANLERIMPGATQAASRDGSGRLVAYTENWANNPFSKGSHSTNRPGYFTSTASHEGKAVGNLLFAGEHTSSFYEWQGFMEGAALSGLRAAGEVLALAQA
ncbi:flavin monoamine oxidase family protein [Arenimonas alkanexedens]